MTFLQSEIGSARVSIVTNTPNCRCAEFRTLRRRGSSVRIPVLVCAKVPIGRDVVLALAGGDHLRADALHDQGPRKQSGGFSLL
jgi:hypothetical protein